MEPLQNNFEMPLMLSYIYVFGNGFRYIWKFDCLKNWHEFSGLIK